MTHAQYETSIDDGSPVVIFDISYGINHFRYTNQADPVVYFGQSFEPFALRSGNVSVGKEDGGLTLTIDAFGRFAPAQLFRVQPPSTDVLITVRTKHSLDPDEEWIVSWVGQIVGAVWSESGERVVVTCQSIGISDEVVALRRPVQRGCPYALYGPGCEVSKAEYEEIIGPFDVNGVTITAADLTTYPTGFFAGGTIQYVNPVTGVVEEIAIKAFDETTGTLILAVIPRNIAGVALFSAFPGCDQTYATCNFRFGNRLRYGGQLLMPTENPYTTSMH